MTTQQPEVGHVIGWTVVLNPDNPQQERVEVSTLKEWEKALRRTDDLASDGWPLGGELFTRIATQSGVEEQLGANPQQVPVGTKMVKLFCRYCRKGDWFLFREQQADSCVCADCNDRDTEPEVGDYEQYETEW